MSTRTGDHTKGAAVNAAPGMTPLTIPEAYKLKAEAGFRPFSCVVCGNRWTYHGNPVLSAKDQGGVA